MRADLLIGDCLAVLPTLPDNSVDAVVTDPPYELTDPKRGGTKSLDIESPYGRARAGGFMGHDWDGTGIAFNPAVWEQLLRVAKPGAFLLAFGGTRTYHRMAVAIEDAGWEIRDCLVWAYAEGFPKNANVGRLIDMRFCVQPGRHCMSNLPPLARRRDGDHLCARTEAGDAHRHEGTALKPAWEPIMMARKPYATSVADTVLAYGTGALNIDGCRLPLNDEDAEAWRNGGGYLKEGSEYLHGQNADFGQGLHVNRGADPSKGRWPANLILTDPIFDGEIAGVIGGGDSAPLPDRPWVGAAGGVAFTGVGGAGTGYHDSGTYSRFFLIPKADKADREPISASGEEALYYEHTCDSVRPSWDDADRSQSAPTATTSPARATSDASVTLDGFGWPTTPNGSGSTGPFPAATRIGTATSRTTRSPTSSASTPSPTSESTPDVNSETASGGSPATFADPSSESTPSTGTSTRGGAPSTVGAGPATSPRSWQPGPNGGGLCPRCGKEVMPSRRERVNVHPT